MQVLETDELIEQSRATETFRKAVRDLEQGTVSTLIHYPRGNPRVKVLRVVYNLLETYPDLDIERVRIEGKSSCSGYVGEATVWPGPKRIRFNWDCKWKAQEENLIDPFGLPDQIRAAQQFGHRCFVSFEEA